MHKKIIAALPQSLQKVELHSIQDMFISGGVTLGIFLYNHLSINMSIFAHIQSIFRVCTLTHHFRLGWNEIRELVFIYTCCAALWISEFVQLVSQQNCEILPSVAAS